MDTGSENLDFHGEALCSISDASLLEIVTKARGKPNGYRKIMKNSKCVFLEINDDRQDVGTTVTFPKLDLSDGELKLAGYISDPRGFLSPKAIQYVYINSRFVYKGPIYKLLNQLAAKFDSLSFWQPATTSCESEKRNKYDMCPMFILNLHCPRSYYDIFTSDRTSVEFKDWGPVLALIESGVMRLWTENISPEKNLSAMAESVGLSFHKSVSCLSRTNHKMKSIERLPEAIHNSVRSGIVICDLARIVEELVFNSIDAGSTKVSVAVGVGNYYVKVDDNGSGFTRDGLLLLGERYATSKIDHSALMDTGSENLDFHGEALCSISDASLLEIVTKARGKPNGYRKIMKNSKCVFLEINDDRQDVGTTVTVRDIFYNQPVRRKHMKSSPKKVLDSIKLSVLRIALVHLNVSFKVLDVESADVLLLTGTSSSPLPILSSYFGIENSVTFHKLDLSDGELKLAGYISDPRGFLSPKAIQYVYINSRFVYKGPIYKLLNQLAAKFDSLSFWQPATTSCESEKRNKYDMCPMFILNLHCPRSYYDIFTSDRTSVEFKDWGPVLALIESGVMRLWTENISPVTSDKDMADTFGRGKKRCRKLNFQTPLYLESPRQKKLRNNYDYMPDLEGWASRYGELFRKASQLNKNPKEADLLSEIDYQNQLHGGYVADYVVTTNAEVRNDPSPCGAAYMFGNDEDSISSTLENNLLAFDAKIFDLSTVSGVVADCFKFSDYAHLDQEPSRNFLRSCSFGRSLLHERNSSPTDERFQLGRNGIRVEKEWNDCDDSMDDKTDLAMCGRDLHHKEASQFQYSPVTQYDMHGTLESPIWDSVKTSLVFGNISPDSSRLGCKWTPGWHCFRPGWSPLTPEKDIGNKFLDDDDDEASYKNLIEGCSELYSSQREGEHKCAFMNLFPDSKSGNGEFRWGDFENMFSPKSSKRIRETNWSDLRLYGEESPRNYSVPASHESEKSNIRNQYTILDNKKIFRRSLSAPLFDRRKTRYMDLTNSSTMLSAKSTSQNTSATLPSTEPGDSSCRKLHSETRNLKCSQTSFGQCHSSPIERPVIDCSIAERPILKITPEVITFENGGPQENGQFGNMEIVECLHSMGIRDPLNTRCKWRNYFLPSAGGSRSDNKNEQHIILDISDFLHLAGDPLTPKSIDRTSLEDAKVLNQVDKKFIAVVAGKTLAMIDQVVTDNGANFKAAGGLLCRRIPTLFWTPCAAHCIDLMMEDICKLKEFDATITHGRSLTTFVYRHGRLLAAMREKTQGRDIVRAGATRFATAVLTLQSLHKNQDALRKLFGSEDWFNSKLAKTVAGKKVHSVVLSTKFWSTVEDCILASIPLLQVLRVVDGDEKPAMAELSAAMDFAKDKMKLGLDKKKRLLNKVIGIIERRWESQMQVDLYGAALFLNPGKFFDIKENDYAYSSQLRMKFNDVLEKMVVDTSLVETISNQADQYENSRNAFGKQLSIRQRKTKSPLDWWGAFGGLTLELAMFAKRIVGLCCSSSGCERNWSTFGFIHTKKRNRLEHQRLNDLVYIQYNRRIATRFQRRREEGTNFNPLVLEEFQWDNEWVNGEVIDPVDNDLWEAVDEALDASTNLEGRRSQRRANVNASSSQRDASPDIEMLEDHVPIILNDDEDVEDDYGYFQPTHNSERNDEYRARDNILNLYDDDI